MYQNTYIRQRFAAKPLSRMSDESLVALVQREDIGTAAKAMTLAHQSRAAMADGDIEAAAYIESLAATLRRA